MRRITVSVQVDAGHPVLRREEGFLPGGGAGGLRQEEL